MSLAAQFAGGGIARTRRTLAKWNPSPLETLRPWLLLSLAVALALLLAVWAVAVLTPSFDFVSITRPPLGVGTLADAADIFTHNLLVLALHAFACVAGFIAGSSLPDQAQGKRGLDRLVHEQGARLAIGFVVLATGFSLVQQVLNLGQSVSRVAGAVDASPAVLLLGVAPHALPELTALFLPLAAWIVASRRGEWDTLLAAAIVTVAIAVPVLLVTALAEIYLAPHVLHALISYP